MNEALIPLARNYRINVMNNEFSHHVKLLSHNSIEESHI